MKIVQCVLKHKMLYNNVDSFYLTVYLYNYIIPKTKQDNLFQANLFFIIYRINIFDAFTDKIRL